MEKPKKEWEGKRIRLIEMTGEINPVDPGTTGTIHKVHTSVDLIEVDWDSNRALGIIPSIDRFEFI